MKLCVSTVVDSNYMAYLPLFVYCMNRTYPQYHVKLFLRDPCPYDLRAWKLNCEMVHMFEDFPRHKYLSIALRFAIPKEYFKDFDNVYITDIDMMILQENRDIEYFHCMEMNETGLCYSNSTRNINHYAGAKSLTGLHFASKKWFEKTEEATAKYRELMRGGLIGLYREFDGVMLYRIAVESGCGLPGKYKLARRHHGIHLNNFMLFKNDRLKLEVRIPPNYRTQWMQFLGNVKFRNIVDECRKDNKELDENLTGLASFIVGDSSR